METAIKEAQTLIGSLGTYSRLVIVGVWFPGFLMLCEFTYIYFRLFGPSDKGPFNFAAEKMKEYDSAVISTFIVIFILAVSIALGYLARDISFAISDIWLRRNWPPRFGETQCVQSPAHRMRPPVHRAEWQSAQTYR